MIDANREICGEAVGCSRRDNLITMAQRKMGNHSFQSNIEKCKSCEEASYQYYEFRASRTKQATALRQLNKEMERCQYQA